MPFRYIDACNERFGCGAGEFFSLFKSALSGKTIKLSLGFSHPVEFTLPDLVEATVEDNVITLSSIDKQLLGQTAAEIRKLRKPEPYKGKGIRYSDEYIIRKAGKAAAGGAEA